MRIAALSVSRQDRPLAGNRAQRSAVTQAAAIVAA